MLAIYDRTWVRRRTALKRLQVVVLFASGLACGAWLSGGQSHADSIIINTAMPLDFTSHVSCTTTPQRLRMACALSTTP